MEYVNLLNQNQAADLLGVSPHRITKWLDRGLIPYVQIGQVRKIDRDALLEWYRSQMVFPSQGCDREKEVSGDGGLGES